MKPLFVICQHGNERSPLKVMEKYPHHRYLIAHPQALTKGVRFIESDLNRSFPGKISGTLEEELACKLVQQLQREAVIIDVHTATCNTPLFAILTKVSNTHVQAIRQLGVRKVVYMKKSIASGKALIDHVQCGVSLECGKEGLPKTLRDLEMCIELFSSGDSQPSPEYFEVYDILKKSATIKDLPRTVVNFRQTSFLGETFYPVLAREKNYTNVLCLKARKVTLQELMLESSQP